MSLFHTYLGTVPTERAVLGVASSGRPRTGEMQGMQAHQAHQASFSGSPAGDAAMIRCNCTPLLPVTQR